MGLLAKISTFSLTPNAAAMLDDTELRVRPRPDRDASIHHTLNPHLLPMIVQVSLSSADKVLVDESGEEASTVWKKLKPSEAG